MTPVKVIPSILTDDPGELARMVRHAEKFTDYVQVDIMDGKFVSSKSISYKDILEVAPKLDWEAHLMVENPEDYVEDFKKAGAGKVIFHYEAAPSPQRVINEVRKSGIKVGLAANPETPAACLFPFLGEIDSVLLLTVRPGFYGSKFVPAVLNKVMELRHKHPRIEIGVDGGINEETIASVVKSGVDAVYIGSRIFWSNDPAASFARFQALAGEVDGDMLRQPT